MTDTNGSSERRPVLVVGGGIAGLSAAVEASEAGHDVVLVERDAAVGGRVSQMGKYFPKMCPPLCGVEIHLKRLRTTHRVKILTNAEVKGVSGSAGAFTVDVEMKPRGVTESCTNCGACVEVCPKDRPNPFNYGMDTTKAIYLPHGAAYPFMHAIDFDHCDGASCGKCVEACTYDAIQLDAQPTTEKLEVSSIVVATGWKPYDAANLTALGGGKIANVIRNVEMERLAGSGGPTDGKIQRPSDGSVPQTVAFVQCAGSRDESHLPHCSAVCCLASLKQARYVLEQNPDAKVTIFYIDVRAPGRLESFLQELEEDERVELVRGKVATIEEDSTTGDVTLTAEETLSGDKIQRTVNLAVLAVGMVPESKSAGFPGDWAVDAYGFLTATDASTGVFSAGCAKRPGDVSACVKDATAAALRTLQVKAPVSEVV